MVINSDESEKWNHFGQELYSKCYTTGRSYLDPHTFVNQVQNNDELTDHVQEQGSNAKPSQIGIVAPERNFVLEGQKFEKQMKCTGQDCDT